MATRAKSSDNNRRGEEFFERIAREPTWSPVYLITGDERWLVDRAVKALIRTVFPTGNDDFNLSIWRGAEAKGLDVSNGCRTLPMFAAQRVCVLRDADEMSAAELGAVADYAADPEPSTLFVIEAVKLNATTRAVKALLAAPKVWAVDFAQLAPGDAARWLGQQARSRKLDLDHDAAGYLIEAIGTSLQQLDFALERVELYAGEQRRGAITLDDVMQVVPDSRGRTVFELIEHVAARRLDLAVGAFHRLASQGESAVGAVVILSNQFRRLLRVQIALREGVSPRDLAGVLGVPGFLATKYEAQARRFHERELKAALKHALIADRALKSSRLRDDLLVERMLMAICGTAR